MEFNNALMGLPMPTMRSFTSKADALKFAIESTATFSLDLTRKPNTEQAKELYDFICKNVELPDVRVNPADGLVEFAKEYIEKLAKVKETCNE
jgi:hypothetical protein